MEPSKSRLPRSKAEVLDLLRREIMRRIDHDIVRPEIPLSERMNAPEWAEPLERTQR